MNDLYIHQLETENKQLRIALKTTRELLEEQQQKIDKANEILSKIIVIYDGNYRPVKNTTKKEVYKTICMLNEILETPHRANYKILGDKK